MTTIDDLLRVYAEGYNAGFTAGRASALGEPNSHQDDPDLDWEKIARHAEANPQSLSPWERELADSALCSIHYGVELTPRQKSKLEWIFRSRFGGKI